MQYIHMEHWGSLLLDLKKEDKQYCIFRTSRTYLKYAEGGEKPILFLNSHFPSDYLFIAG